MPLKIKFKLIDGKLFEWNYFGYSELIDNLDPEENSIIPVFEKFTYENFEEAHINYINYVKYKECIFDIQNLEKLWSKNDLREFSQNYCLLNSVFNWLLIKETEEERLINLYIMVETHLNSFNLLINDNILCYYISNFENRDKFLNACNCGHLESFEWLYKQFNFDNNFLKISFQDACLKGCLEIAKILYNDIDISNSEIIDLFNLVVLNGNIDVLKWLYSIGYSHSYLEDENFIEINEEMLISACSGGNIDIVKWIFDKKRLDIHMNNDECLCNACVFGNLEVCQFLYEKSTNEKEIYGEFTIEAKRKAFFDAFNVRASLDILEWIYSIGDIDIHFNDEYYFKIACDYGDLKFAQWIYKIGSKSGGIEIHGNNFQVFRESCKSNNLEMAKWLYSISKYNQSLPKLSIKEISIETRFQRIKEWLETLY